MLRTDFDFIVEKVCSHTKLFITTFISPIVKFMPGQTSHIVMCNVATELTSTTQH